jgi:hypothetical protein
MGSRLSVDLSSVSDVKGLQSLVPLKTGSIIGHVLAEAYFGTFSS